MNIFITGNSGFLGLHITDILLKQKHSVTSFDIKENEHRARKTKFITGTIMDKPAMLEACWGSDCIIHLAAEHQDFGITEKEYFDINQIGTRNVIACARELNIRKIIFCSSVAVYGPSTTIADENTPPHPDSNYGKSKLAAEKELEQWVREDTANCCVIIRPTAIYGEHMNDYTNIFRLINTINQKKFFFVGDYQNIKSIAYVKNVAQATVFLLHHFNAGLQVFDYVDEPQLTAREISLLISKYLNKPIPRINLPYTAILFFASVIDVLCKLTRINFPITATRIKKLKESTCFSAKKISNLGFVPEFDNVSGLEKTCAWFLAHYSNQ